MIETFPWWDGSQLPPTAVPVALVCGLCGAVVLSLFTRWMGLTSLLINGVVLCIGAYVANVLTAGLTIPLERYYVKPIIMSFLGMSASSVLVLMLFSRSRNTE